MPEQTSPTVKRRRLAAELRRYRDAAGMTLDEVADELEWSKAKISRIENARVGVLPRDVKFLLGVYGVEGSRREMLLSLARESRQKGWWRVYGEVVPEWFEVFVGLESEATRLRAYEAQLVPGLLQTPDYAREVLRATRIGAEDEDIDKLVDLATDRQEIFQRKEGAPSLAVVVDEAALRRVVGGPAVMAAQLHRLVAAAKAPNAVVQVLPYGAGAHPAMSGAFQILGFPNHTDPDVAYVEYPTGTVYLDKPPEVARYALIFDRLGAAALDADASRALIVRVAEEMDRAAGTPGAHSPPR